jgi:hypothetical protein
MLVDALLMVSCTMLTSDLQFDLPPSLIAQSPSDQRDGSRLLVYNRENDSVSHHHFHEFPICSPPSSPFCEMMYPFSKPASLESALRVEQLNVYYSARQTLLKPPGDACSNRGAKPHGQKLLDWIKNTMPKFWNLYPLENTSYGFICPRIRMPPPLPNGSVRFLSPPMSGDQQTGQMKNATKPSMPKMTNEVRWLPLPPGCTSPQQFWTSYRQMGTRCTTSPSRLGLVHSVRSKPKRWKTTPCMPKNIFFLPQTKSVLRDPSIKRLAIGTTCVRAIEHYLGTNDPHPSEPTRADARLFIRPPYSFLGVDHLLTNFHLPGSTLLCLVSAFLTSGSPDGLDRLKELYQEAIDKKYRFFSYGDAMLIL